MRGFFKFLIWFAIVAGVFVGVMLLGVVEVWTVPTDDPQLALSIQPNMLAGDVVLVAKHSRPDEGELVRCLDPDAPGRYVVGRVVGKSGDEVTILQDTLRVNNKREPTGSPCEPTHVVMTAPQNQAEVDISCNYEEFAGRTTGIMRGISDHDADFNAKVDTGKIFLASDNRRLHEDSRDFGQLNPDTCLQIVYRLWGAAGISESGRRFTFLW